MPYPIAEKEQDFSLSDCISNCSLSNSVSLCDSPLIVRSPAIVKSPL